jgi:hypothetical protein
MIAPSEPEAGGAEVPVLIAGGGLVGLSTAMFLAQSACKRIASPASWW